MTIKDFNQMNSIEKAKELFFQYDGSRFYMSRNGVEDEFAIYNISEALQKQWLLELREQKLAKLGERSNWRIIHFLNHHALEGYLDKLISNEPLGDFWEKCTYLEELVKYTNNTQRPNKLLLEKVLEYFNFWIIKIKEIAKSEQSKQRIIEIEKKISEFVQRH